MENKLNDKNENGLALINALSIYRRNNPKEKRLTIRTDESNDYEIVLEKDEECNNESLVVDLVVLLNDLNRCGVVNFSSMCYFSMPTQDYQSILLYDSRDVSEDEPQDKGTVTI